MFSSAQLCQKYINIYHVVRIPDPTKAIKDNYNIARCFHHRSYVTQKCKHRLYAEFIMQSEFNGTTFQN